MDAILIKTKDEKKTINNRLFEEITKDFSKKDQEYVIIKDIFDSINSQEEIILYLKNIRNTITPASMLLIIKMLSGFSIINVYHFFDEIMIDK